MKLSGILSHLRSRIDLFAWEGMDNRMSFTTQSYTVLESIRHNIVTGNRYD